MIEIEFIKDYATYKAKETGIFSKILACKIISQGVAKIKKKRKSKKVE